MANFPKNPSFGDVATLARGWTLTDHARAITKTFTFCDFIQAFSFMTVVALHAEKLNHHPDWSNCYHLVTIKLMTLDEGELTQNDIRFAHKINEFYEQWEKKEGLY